ncbi:MAG: N-acetyl-gamma-glutamyl-phosphate reductase [Pseudomonadota bacterium]
MSVPAVVVGASGYVGGELLRLIAAHPTFRLHAAVSGSNADKPIASVFRNLTTAYANQSFCEFERWADGLASGQSVAVFSAAPHGASAAVIRQILKDASRKNIMVRIVDASADFRYADAESFEAVYGGTHGAPELLENFSCAVPEHANVVASEHVGHPGCFATAMLLGIVPMTALSLVQGPIYVSAITGSTGSGQSPSVGTHHPERHSNLYAYKPLQHRHVPEVTGLTAAATGQSPAVQFVPHSGPFARGIHATIQASLNGRRSLVDVLELLGEFYAPHPFVEVRELTPRIKDVVGGNNAIISAAVSEQSIAVFVAIDNLVKGAAGGCVQWMNRLFDLPQTEGLTAPSAAWS